MKIFYANRKIQFRHFSDLSALNGLISAEDLKLRVPAQENFVIQFIVLPEKEKAIRSVSVNGEMDAVCVNTQGVDKFGKPFSQKICLRKEHIQPVFVILKADPANEGSTKTAEVVFDTDQGVQKIKLTVDFTGEYVPNGGFNDITRLSRLLWLNSSRFLDNTVVEPFTEPEITGSKIRILGREIYIAESGLVKNAEYYFDEGVNLTNDVRGSLFASPLEFSVGKEEIVYSGMTLEKNGGSVSISASGESAGLQVKLAGILHYEGSVDYKILVTAKQDLTCSNISLKAKINASCAQFINGLGAYGSYAHNIRYKWEETKQQDTFYVGAVNAGVRFKWKAQDYVRPLVNIYYKNLPLHIPTETWDNGGRGGIRFETGKEVCVLDAYTGAFRMKAGESRSFDFELHFTPFKPVDYKKHYAVRHSHYNNLKNGYKQVDEAAGLGLNYVNIHHGSEYHPFINYPFIETENLKHLVQYAAYKDIGVNVYYTVREHSNHMAEVFAYKALGDEIIYRKNGDGHSWWKGVPEWLTEYFGDTILPAWRVYYKHGKYKGDADISFIVRPDSRLDNYYIEGLDWLIKNIGIKGIYIDDTSLDRTTVERAKKVLAQNGGMIDMHMWNHEEPRAGDTSCMNLYTEILPFLDSLWIGEGYAYKKLSPEYLLMEVSGIPYGNASQMLEGGGEPFIGMLYAMNNRYGWGVKNAHHIYKLWDDFGIEDSEMRGWWHSQNPVCTGNDEVKATAYLKKGSALICMYNFGRHAAYIRPRIQETLLGFSPRTAFRPHIGTIQHGGRADLHKGLCLGAKKGMILEVKA